MKLFEIKKGTLVTMAEVEPVAHYSYQPDLGSIRKIEETYLTEDKIFELEEMLIDPWKINLIWDFSSGYNRVVEAILSTLNLSEAYCECYINSIQNWINLGYAGFITDRKANKIMLVRLDNLRVI